MPVRDLDLDDVVAFVHVVDAGGITAAARVLQAPKSSVSRRVARLEQRLGTRLLQRTTRSVTLTDAGHEFHTRVAPALAEVRDAADAAFDAREVPRGTVRFAALPDVGAEVLPALVAGFAAAHALVRVELDLDADPESLLDTGHDLALCAGRPVGRGLTAYLLQDMTLGLYAAPAYLARAGTPATPADLAGHECVLFRPEAGRGRWRLHRDGSDGPGSGRSVEVVVHGRVAADDTGVVRRAAVAGAGVALLPRLVGELSVAAGELRPVLPDHRSDAAPLHLVHPARRHVPLAVRALRDHLLRHFPR